MLRTITHFLTEKTSPTWFALMAGLAIALTAGLSFSLPYAEPDLWGHVQFGRDALQNGIAKTTSYSFTANGYPWVNHENLSEITFALAIDRFGVWSLLFAKCLLGILIVASIAWQARRNGASWLVTSATVLLFAATVGSFWQIRPQIVSFAFFAAMILLLDRVFDGWDQQWHLPWVKDDARFDRYRCCRLEKRQLRWLWASVPLFALWANAHGGFVAGYCLFCAYLFVRGYELWAEKSDESRDALGSLFVIGIMAGMATLATPYGIELHRWLLASLNSPRPEINEWHALSADSEAFLPFLAMGTLSLFSLVFSRRALDATHLTLLALTTWQALSHQRHVPFVALLICYWLPIHWNSLFERLTKTDGEDLAPSRWMQFGLLGVNIVLICTLVTRMSTLKVDKSHYPVSAVQFIHDQEIGGRLVVTYNWAQYLIGAFGESGVLPPRAFADPDAFESDRSRRIRVAFDGRFRTCYPQRVVDEHFDFILGPHFQSGRFRTTEADPEKVLSTGDPDLVLISRTQVPSTEVMSRQNDWVLLYQDKIAQLWGRASKYDNPANENYIAATLRIIGDVEQEGFVAWPAMPSTETQLVAQGMDTVGETVPVSTSNDDARISESETEL